MAIAISEEHQELARVARSFLQDNEARQGTRELLDAPEETLPTFWKSMAELGWLGVLVPENGEQVCGEWMIQGCERHSGEVIGSS